jgi:hypothetical protein
MRIRDLKWKEVPMWPPEWWITDQGSGEEGLLEGVILRKDKMPPCIYVSAEHHGAEIKGIIILENPVHLDTLYHVLRENIGKSLREIGDLEIDFGLSVPRKGPKQVRPRTKLESEKIILTKKSYINGN